MMSFVSNIAKWLFAPSTTQALNVQKKKRSLEKRQRILAQEIEGLFGAFDDRLRDLSTRLRSVDDGELAAEAAAIENAQDEMRVMMRRMEAAIKSDRELERELAEWESCNPKIESRVPRADHPSVRREIIRSELIVRRAAGRPKRLGAASRPASAVNPFRACIHVEPLPDADAGHLLLAIRDATREAERWHAIPPEDRGEDAILQIRHLRELHAVLKRLDKKFGVARDRLALAVRMSD